MVSLIKSFLLVVLGAALGALGALLWVKHQENAPRVARVPAPVAVAPTAPVREPAAPPGLFGKPGDAPSSETSGATESPPPPPAEETPAPVVETPPAPVDPAPPPVVDTPQPEVPPVQEPPVDFGELCIKPAAWPPVITLNKAIDAQILQGNEVIGELPLAAGERLQVTKVFGDGTVEVRAKGAKFIVDHKVTDLEPQARARLAEISGRPRAPAPQPVAPRAEPARPEEPSRPQPAPPADDDLDRRMRTLFGTPSKR